MKVLKKVEFPTTSFGKSTHDWPAILGAKVDRAALGKPGPAVALTEGDDFTGDPDNFVSTIRSRGAERHLKTKCAVIKEEGKPTLIYVQVADMTDEEAANADATIERQEAASKARVEKKRAEAKAAKDKEKGAVAGTIPPQSQVG